MKKKPEKNSAPGMKAEYDFSKGVRGYYASRIPPGSKMRRLTPAQARRWIEEREARKRRETQTLDWLALLAVSAAKGNDKSRLAALEKSIRDLRRTVATLEDRAGIRGTEPARKARDQAARIEATFLRFKSELLEHARNLRENG